MVGQYELPVVQDDLLLRVALLVFLCPGFVPDSFCDLGPDFCPSSVRGGGLRVEYALVSLFPDLPEGESWQQIPYEI
jgi:hypothetical protein